MILWDWLLYFWHGILQAIGIIVPILEPAMEPVIPYDFFEDCEEFYATWGSLLDENRRPGETWMELYWDCMWRIFINRVEDQVLVLIDKVMHYVVFAVGMLPLPFHTIPAWLLHFVQQIGEILPDWATNIASGLVRLWELIPEPIRDGLLTWAEFIEGAPEAIKEWVREFIGWAIDWINELWDWYESVGHTLTVWWEWAQGLLSEIVEDAYAWLGRTLGAAWAFLVWFWNNPTGALASWLSPWWEQLVTFASDCLDFWYNVWGEYAEDLADFLADPLDFLWDRGEAWLNRRLEQP